MSPEHIDMFSDITISISLKYWYFVFRLLDVFSWTSLWKSTKLLLNRKFSDEGQRDENLKDPEKGLNVTVIGTTWKELGGILIDLTAWKAARGPMASPVRNQTSRGSTLRDVQLSGSLRSLSRRTIRQALSGSSASRFGSTSRILKYLKQ